MLTESSLEDHTIELLKNLGYQYLHGPDIAPDSENPERNSYSQVILEEHLKKAINDINPNAPEEAKTQAIKEILNLGAAAEPLFLNERFHTFLTDGVEVEYNTADGIRGDKIWLVDSENITANEFLAINQFTVIEGNNNKRPDIILFINGLPLVVIELKNPADENATLKKAYTQLQNYKDAIPSLFHYNSLLVISDGLDARMGSLSSGWSRFMSWKTKDGKTEEGMTTPQLDTLLHGALRPDILLKLIKDFTVFQKELSYDKQGMAHIETVKKIAAYHQFYAVEKAVASTHKAAHEEGNRKAGVVWHTQGSGKSLSMVFYAGKLVQSLDNPTILVITDRNDLDGQLFDTFASSKQLLRQEPVQAESRDHLKKLLKTSGGRIVFATIQKFFPEDGAEMFPELSDRRNIVVIADEAHRSQYGFKAKTAIKDGEARTTYGFAKYLRDAIPHATFIGFTGTPIEKEDASTPAVFGHYIDVYDIEQAVKDGATVPIYYESRMVKIHLKPEETQNLDEEVAAITEDEESTATEKAKAKWTQLEAIIGHPERLKTIAEDIVKHFEERQNVFEGKGMIVTMSRRIAVDLYEEIVKLRPKWNDKSKFKGVIKVVMTSASSDPQNWQQHHTSKEDRKLLAERLKDPNDPLKLVIVRDMWLTGFDAPCLHTLYIDKPMRGHTLMQAIARVNRIYKDKPGGLVVDYIGIAGDLKKALIDYTESGGQGSPTLDQNEAIAAMKEKHEVVAQMFTGFDYQKYFKADTYEKLKIILEAQEHILGLERGKDRFTKEVSLLSKAFALAIPSPKAMALKEEVGFFQAVKARLVKFEPSGTGKSDAEIETAIRQIVDRAVVSDGIIDVFDAAGIKKPDISILSDEFMAEIKGMEHKNLAIELLKKILNDEIKSRAKRNMVQSKKLSEMLEQAIKRYQNNLLSAAEVIQELIELAKEIKGADHRGEELGLSDDEMAFYDALAMNGSAKEVLGDDQLRELARVLVEKVKFNTSIDWTVRESVQAKLRTLVKRTLRKYGYPPDQQKLAMDRILEQSELFADEWSA